VYRLAGQVLRVEVHRRPSPSRAARRRWSSTRPAPSPRSRSDRWPTGHAAHAVGGWRAASGCTRSPSSYYSGWPGSSPLRRTRTFVATERRSAHTSTQTPKPPHPARRADPGLPAAGTAVPDTRALTEGNRIRMTRQTRAPLTRLPTTAGLWSIEEYTNRIRRGEMLLDPAYQRGPTLKRPATHRPDEFLAAGRAGPCRRTQRADEPGLAAHRPRPARQLRRGGRPATAGDRPRVAGRTPRDPRLVAAGGLDPQQRHRRRPVRAGHRPAQPRPVDRLMDVPCVCARLTSVAAEAALYLLVNGAGTPQSTADLARAAAIAAR
jgi:hypothetical protein